jgi:hypothetical protein
MHPLDAPPPMRCALDAIDALLAILDDEPATTLVALVDHLPHGARVALPVDGGDPGPAGAEALAGLLAAALDGLAGARVVLGSIRHHGDDTVAEADLATWRSLSARHRGGPITLLDWFVITDVAVLSLAELAGPRPRWC